MYSPTMTTPATGPSEVGDAPEAPELDGVPEADEHETNEQEFLEQMNQHHDGILALTSRYLGLPHHQRSLAGTNYARHLRHQHSNEKEFVHRILQKKRHSPG